MIHPTLSFVIELDYLLHQFSPLVDKAIYHYYNHSTGKYVWVFYVKDMDFVIKEIGKSLSFEEAQEDILSVIQLCPPLKERINTEQWKGKGEINVIETPEVFLVGEWQKDPETGIPKQTFQTVSKQNVLALWEVIKTYPIGKFIKVRTISEHLCISLKFDRFFRDTGTFSWQLWWGSHRSGYLPYAYYPAKVLGYLGVIEYSKAGKIKRLKEELTFQTKINA